jgi:hypothetical protein
MVSMVKQAWIRKSSSSLWSDYTLTIDTTTMTKINSNPWASFQKPSIFHALTHLLDTSPKPATLPSLPVVHTPSFEHPVMEPRVMWLGHAGCYLQLPNQGGSYGVLFDPIFSDRYVLSYNLVLGLMIAAHLVDCLDLRGGCRVLVVFRICWRSI